MEVEEQVSLQLRNNLRFSCWEVNTREERLALEKGLIALLAQSTLGYPSEGWIGKYAHDKTILKSGIWNVQHVDAMPLSEVCIDRLEELSGL